MSVLTRSDSVSSKAAIAFEASGMAFQILTYLVGALGLAATLLILWKKYRGRSSRMNIHELEAVEP